MKKRERLSAGASLMVTLSLLPPILIALFFAWQIVVMVVGPLLFAPAFVVIVWCSLLAVLVGIAFFARKLYVFFRWEKIEDESACSKCGYNLTGNVSGRCPECGRPT